MGGTLVPLQLQAVILGILSLASFLAQVVEAVTSAVASSGPCDSPPVTRGPRDHEQQLSRWDIMVTSRDYVFGAVASKAAIAARTMQCISRL